MEYKITTATDMYNGNIHNYPVEEKDKHLVVYKFDFIFTKNNKWYYVSSNNNNKMFIKMELNHPVEDKNESWAIINAITGKIINSNMN